MMIWNYILVAFRNISRHPTYAMINIVGLSLGVICSLLLMLFVIDEIGFDRHHSKSGRIYRIASHLTVQDKDLELATTMSPLGPTLAEGYAGIDSFLRIKGSGELLVMSDDQKFYEDRVYIVDSSFFQFFDVTLKSGERNSCLVEPNSIVISESLAKKYFGDYDPIGKILRTGGDEIARTITGVMADPPHNSHLNPSALISYSSLPENTPISWGTFNDHTYLLVSENHDLDKLSKRLDFATEKHILPLFEQFNTRTAFFLQPLEDIYLYSNLEGELEPTGEIEYIYIFIAIALFTLLIASINYMNLATARSVNRSREVGIRKAMGSYRLHLIGQFMIESIILAAVAVMISSIIVFFLIPGFNEFSGKDLPVNFLTDPAIIGTLIVIVIIVGLVGGSYPALFLSAFQPSEVLKGRNAGKAGHPSLRRSLVVVQFSISMFMVISTWVVFDQLSFLRSKDLGFAKDRVLRISMNGPDVMSKYDVLRNKYLSNSMVESVGSGGSTPGGNNHNMSGFAVESVSGDMTEKVFQSMGVDKNYFSTLDIPIVDGRGFSNNVSLDTAQSIIVNEKMVEYMEWKEPLGKKFQVFTNEALDYKTMTVIGVMRDFHLRALNEPITPLVVLNSVQNDNLLVRLSSKDMSKTIEFLEEEWYKVVPNRPFEYNFIEHDFNEHYLTDQKRGEVFGLFAIFTILISCLGLFGLASYTAEHRKKEIGIRKAIGAGTLTIVKMMSLEFLRLVMISVMIAFPISYLIMKRWLEEFAFQTDINPISFVLSAVFTLVIAFLTVSYHSFSSANSNPSHSLRE